MLRGGWIPERKECPWDDRHAIPRVNRLYMPVSPMRVWVVTVSLSDPHSHMGVTACNNMSSTINRVLVHGSRTLLQLLAVTHHGRKGKEGNRLGIYDDFLIVKSS